MVEFEAAEMSWRWFCIFGHRGGGYTTKWDAEQADLSHDCYGWKAI